MMIIFSTTPNMRHPVPRRMEIKQSCVCVCVLQESKEAFLPRFDH